MTVPSREEAARLLLSLDPPAWHVRHSRAVAEVAAWLARRVAHPTWAGATSVSRGGIDRGLVEAAALLHDVDKAIRRGVRGGAHGEAGGRWLASRDHPELAEAVALHPVTLLVDAAGVSRVRAASVEARIVAYADKRAGQRLEPMTERFARWGRRHPHSRAGHGWSAEVAAHAWRAAQELEAEVCGLAGCRPEDVRRLRWTGAALAAARR